MMACCTWGGPLSATPKAVGVSEFRSVYHMEHRKAVGLTECHTAFKDPKSLRKVRLSQIGEPEPKSP